MTVLNFGYRGDAAVEGRQSFFARIRKFHFHESDVIQPQTHRINLGTPVPGAKPWIIGLANVRGSLLTIVDLAWILTGVRSPVTQRSRLLAISLHKAPIGLLIDEVFGQRHFLDNDAVSSELPEDSPLRKVVSKQHRFGSETWQELDLDQLINMAEFLNGAAS